MAHYELGFEESRLFVDGRSRLEYVRTLELLDRLLPVPPADVLDVGGGTGAYAVPLARRGYHVQVVDPVTLHIDRVREIASDLALPGLTGTVGDARDLTGFEGYAATLLLGPLYHLVDPEDRGRAFAQAGSATRPGGVVIAVGISRYSSLFWGLKGRFLGDGVFRAIVERDLREGQHRNPYVQEHPEWFTTAYFHLPEELRSEALEAGLTDVRLFAVEGAGWILEDVDDIDNQLYAAQVTESEPALMAATSHIMVSGKRAGRSDLPPGPTTGGARS